MCVSYSGINVRVLLIEPIISYNINTAGALLYILGSTSSSIILNYCGFVCCRARLEL